LRLPSIVDSRHIAIWFFTFY